MIVAGFLIAAGIGIRILFTLSAGKAPQQKPHDIHDNDQHQNGTDHARHIATNTEMAQ